MRINFSTDIYSYVPQGLSLDSPDIVGDSRAEKVIMDFALKYKDNVQAVW